jgi:PPOX class probable F420-dependent enzyme
MKGEMAMTAIPENYHDLFQKKAFAHLATVMPDGSPQVTPVWCDFDGTHIRINSAAGRVKDRNMRRNNKVALAIMDPDNAYRYLGVLGQVAGVTEGPEAEAHIEALAKKYIDQPYPGRQPGERRVMYRIRPDRVSGMG